MEQYCSQLLLFADWAGLTQNQDNLFIALRSAINPIALNVISIIFEIRLHKSTLKKRNKYI